MRLQNILGSTISIMGQFMKGTIGRESALKLRNIWFASRQYSLILWSQSKKEDS